LTWANGNKYSGEFKDGLYNGQGILILSNGERYLGEFKDSSYYGQGTLNLNKVTQNQG
jgi:hypothetical protein